MSEKKDPFMALAINSRYEETLVITSGTSRLLQSKEVALITPITVILPNTSAPPLSP